MPQYTHIWRRSPHLPSQLLVLTLGLLLSLAAPNRFIPSAFSHEDFIEQLELLSGRLASHPADAQILLMRGMVYLEHAYLREALADFDRALEVAPDYLEPHIYHAMALHQLNQSPQALQELNEYVRSGPPHYRAYELRATVRERFKDLQGAIEDLTAAIKRLPRPEQFSWRARLLLQAGDVDAAIQNYEEGCSVLGEPIALAVALVKLQADQGRYDDALRSVARLEERSPRRAHWSLRRADILSRAGRPAQAQAAYEEALSQLEVRIQTGRAVPYDLLHKAQALAGLGRYEEARALLGSLDPGLQQLEEYQQLQQSLRQAGGVR